MLSVGLTGGIASGKSLAAELLQALGAFLVDADAVAREIAEPGQEGWQRIVDNFGAGMLKPDGTIDREKLGSIVFSLDEKREFLNNLLHPLIIEKVAKKMKQIALNNPAAIIVVELPLLVECGLQRDFDRIIVVWADRKAQKKRLMERNGLQENEAESRLNSQIHLDEKRKYADYIVENKGTKKEMEQQVIQVYNLLKSDLKKAGEK